MTIHAYTDGASRGNPGESAIGVVLKDEQGNVIRCIGRYIGTATNNMAEYTALLACLAMVQETKCRHLIVYTDSELMARQLSGQYRVKDSRLKTMFREIQEKLDAAAYTFELRQIARDQNSEADVLANRSLNLKRSIET
ncbi:MAG: ribonuclease HI family protein [Ignavibacteria bacterium]|nr:ribonuclease HI family protein [Ignavibacteria bacterium]